MQIKIVKKQGKRLVKIQKEISRNKDTTRDKQNSWKQINLYMKKKLHKDNLVSEKGDKTN